MKRIHLFEFEDFPWFPNWLRIRMTRYIVAFHKILGSAPVLADLVNRALDHSKEKKVLDLCSGSGGPMPEVAEILRSEHGHKDLKLVMSDLYPNEEAAAEINSAGQSTNQYLTEPVNAADVPDEENAVRTMICSMHHMRPEVAKSILRDAKEDKQPICVFEISDNSQPKWLWWTAIPFAYLATFFITPMIRPMTWQQIVFTYIFPVIPFFVAWDGAVSNARTYTIEDMDELLKDLRSDDYVWETGVVKSKRAKNAYLLGYPA